MGCHFLLQGIFPAQESNPPRVLHANPADGFFTTELPGKPYHILKMMIKVIILNVSVNAFFFLMVQFSSVPFSQSVKSNSLRSHELQHTRLPCPSLSPSLLKVIQPSHPLSLPSPSIFPSIRVFSNESALQIRYFLKYWSFRFSISPSNNRLKP